MRLNEPYRSWTETSAKSSLWTRRLSRLVFPLHEKLKGHDSVARLHALERSQWWRSEELERHQLARLKELLAYAGRHVPYYRALFKEIGFEPASGYTWPRVRDRLFEVYAAAVAAADVEKGIRT